MNEPNDNTPRVVRSEEVFKGRIFNVTRDEVQEHGDEILVREIVQHAGSACILPLFDDGTIALVRQYRHPARAFLLEIPAGSRDRDEAPEACARRELEEEIGFAAGELRFIGEFYPSPGFLAEKMWVYLATGLRPATQRLDDDEQFEVVRIPFQQALTMIESGEIQDGKTIIALALFASCLPNADANGTPQEPIALSFLTSCDGASDAP